MKWLLTAGFLLSSCVATLPFAFAPYAEAAFGGDYTGPNRGDWERDPVYTVGVQLIPAPAAPELARPAPAPIVVEAPVHEHEPVQRPERPPVEEGLTPTQHVTIWSSLGVLIAGLGEWFRRSRKNGPVVG